MDRSLEGLTVVSVEQAVAAPYASCRLADAGARVIKVERPEGDFARDYDTMVNGQSAYFVWLNRGKESIRLDLKSQHDLALLKGLISEADVFLQNLKPGSLDKLGLSSTDLRNLHPTLITCEITGFGRDGPFSDLKAYDLIVQAEAGLCSITGTSDGPARVGVSVCDIAAGMNAHAAILEALFHRERSGDGSSIQISLFDAIADWMNVPMLQLSYGGHETRRAGVNHPTLAPYGAYRTADAVDVIFSVQNDREWIAFCEKVLQRPNLTRAGGFADNMARLANREALDRIIAELFSGFVARDIMALLEAAGIAYGRMNTVGDLCSHPHTRKIAIETPRGPVDIIAPAPIWNGNTAPRLGAVPGLGDHDEFVRAVSREDGMSI